MSENGQRFRIGVFVLVAMLVLAVLITLFSGAPSLFTPHHRYTVVLSNAAGVGPGTPVRRSGVRIGQVQDLQLDDQTGNVRIGILIERKYGLRKNEAPLLNRGFLGDTTIDFVTRPGDGKTPADVALVEPGTEFQGLTQPDVQTILNQANELLPGTQESMREVGKAAKTLNDFSPELSRTNDEARIATRNWGKLGERLDVLVQTQQDKLIKTLEDLDDTLTRIGKMFNDDNQRNLNATLRNVRQASDSLDSITKNTDELIKESRKTMGRVDGSLARTDEVLANLQKTTKPMAERSEKVMKNLDESTERLNRVLMDTQELVRAFGRSNGTISKLMNDPELYNNLNDAACMLTRLMPRVDRILRDMEVFADKIARHPESLGVGGAVRPGSGIK